MFSKFFKGSGSHGSSVVVRTTIAGAALAAAACLVAPRFASAAVVASENFDNTSTYPLNSNLAGDGSWLDTSGGTNKGFQIIAAPGNGDNSGQVLGNPDATNVYEPVSTGYANTDAVYYSAWMRETYVTSGSNLYSGTTVTMYTGDPVSSSSYIGPVFGMTSYYNGGYNPSGLFQLSRASSGTTYLSTTSVTLNDWYNVRLQVTQNASNPALDTGTLYAEDITAGQTSFTAVISNVNLQMAPFRDPTNINYWMLNGYGGGQMDNLETGTGTPSASVPEPATLGLVAVGGLGLLLLKRRKAV